MNRSIGATASALLICLLVGCSAGDDERKLIESAQAFMSRNEPKSAVLQLKNALQKNPDSAEARFLMGKALQATGDPAAALVELNKAAALGFDDNKVVPAIAYSMLVQQMDRQLVELHQNTVLTEPAGTAELRTLVATALARMGQPAKAQAQIDKALELAPAATGALLMQARIKASAGDPAAARSLVERVTQAEPGNPEGWHLLGALNMHALNDPQAALAAYDKALSVRPGHTQSHAHAIVLQMRRGEMVDARRRLDAMKSALPNHPQTAYVESQLLMASGEPQKAREVVQSLLKIAPQNANLIQLAGAIEFEVGTLVQTETLLLRALSLDPELAPARNLLARTYLRLGQPNRAIAALSPLLGRTEIEADTLGIAAEAQLLAGNVREAEALYARAAKAAPGDTRLRTAMALMDLSRGRTDEAFAQLGRIAADDDGTFADLALVTAHLRRSEFDAALKAIDSLSRKTPGKPLPESLRGDALLAKRDVAGARAAYERALAADAAYFPAAQKLATLDLQDKKPDAARARLESVLKADPRHASALLMLAELEARNGGSRQRIEELLGKAILANPTQAEPRVVLVRHYLALKDLKPALIAAQEAAAALPDHPAVVGMLAQAQWRSGDTQQALASFKRVVTLQPAAAYPLLQLAEFQRATGDARAAAASLRRSVELDPNLVPAQQALVEVAIQTKDFTGALAVARDLQKRQPKLGLGHALEGTVEASRDNHAAAVTAYRTSLQVAPSSDVAIRLHKSLSKLERRAEAEQLASTWLKSHPRDIAFLIHAAGAAESARQWALAEQRYRSVLQMNPDNPIANNNLAWVLIRSNRPGFLTYAARAYQVLPSDPGVIDTMALALALDTQTDKALEMQRKLVDAAPEVYGYRLTLARIYALAGRKDAARSELERLARLGSRFERQDEVADLLKTL